MSENKFTQFMQKAWAVIKRTAKRVWEYLKVAKMEWIVMIALFALDLITKSIVVNTVPLTPVVLIPDFLQIRYVPNPNAAYGSDFIVRLLTKDGARIFFSVFAVAASVAFILILIRNKGKNKLFRIGIAMFVAGAMGNCMDRMFLGYVRDFIHFMFQEYIFNIADAELIFGVVLIVIYLLFFFHDGDKKSKDVVIEPTKEAVAAPDSAEASGAEETPNVTQSAEGEGSTPDEDLQNVAEDIPPATDDADSGAVAGETEQLNSDAENATAEEQT